MQDHAKALEKLKSSAMGAATVRAFAALEPDEKIRNPDYLARELLDPAMRPELDAPQKIEAFRAQLEQILPGAYHFQNARTLHIDACLKQAIDEGFKQVVILGAGFDTRAYRFGNEKNNVHFFEVDLPELQIDKTDKITALLGARPNYIEYIALNFNTQPLDNILQASGYDATLPTFFIWEGVSYYLAASGVDATLGFVSKYGASGSRIIFDYMPRAMVDGSGDYYGGAESRAYMAKFGEPLLFGIEDGAVESFLRHQGFEPASFFSNIELENKYLIDSHSNLHGRISGYVRMVEAVVRKER
ncbi:MAG: hypothetical protein JWM78_990 [Verrucomicrobiaceae bacterium]|nr:hypothetical protein [Verrucomicrobiaceae bacterium]